MADERQLEEIVVSAQRMEQVLQDVPISLAVVGEQEIAELNIFDFTETAALTPGADFTPGGQSAAIRIRGVGPGSFTLTAPQSVAVFMDEFSQIAIGVVFRTLVDVERLELLRGPQGTLYGLNAPSGAYNITTRAPNTEQVEGYIESSYSQFDNGGLDTKDFRGAINIPLVKDTLAIRLAGAYVDSEGFVQVENPRAGTDATGGVEQTSLRSRLRWDINPDMDLTWGVAYNDADDNPSFSFNVEGLVPGTGEGTELPAVFNKFEDNRYYGDFVSVAESDLLDTNLHYRWSAPWFNLDYLFSYQELSSDLFDNREPYPGFLSSFDIRLDSEQYTTELRFSNSSESLDYIAGLFYSERELTDGDFDLNVAGAQLVGPASGLSTSMAAFANLTFHLTDAWDVTTGARYEMNEIETQSEFNFLGLQSIVDDDLDFDHLSWSFKLRNYISDDLTAYLAIDNAYKQGGFNNLTPALGTLVPVFPQLPGLAEASQRMLTFDEETSTAIEIGAKGTALEGRMNYSVAVFYQQFDDHQVTQATAAALDTRFGDLNTLFLNQLVNVDEVVTKGIEADATLLFGDYWSLTGRVAYFDPEIEEWNFRFCPEGEESSPTQLICPADGGERLNDLPNWNTNVQLAQARPISSNWVFYGRASWTWESARDTSDEREDFDPYNLLGLTLGLRSTQSGLDVRIWGKNLLDENGLNPSLRSGLDSSLAENQLDGEYRPGREYGITLSYSFD
ncbi:MAG: TonB-dependent receptor [Halioglobus sp.]